MSTGLLYQKSQARWRRFACYQSRLTRNCIVRVPLPKVNCPKVVEVGLELPMSRDQPQRQSKTVAASCM
jgi:hypothetical protein